MTDREKVIKGLKICTSRPCYCTGCPYKADCYLDSQEVMEDALSLLQEQNPRVITREELKQFEGSPCWFESSGTYMGKEGFWIIPATFHMFSAGITMSYTSVLDGVVGCSELGLSAYNKTWRCWTAKPTIKQREMVKWNE